MLHSGNLWQGFFDLVILQIRYSSPNKKIPIEVNTCVPMAYRVLADQLYQYQWRAISPNLMLAKVTLYTVYYYSKINSLWAITRQNIVYSEQ